MRFGGGVLIAGLTSALGNGLVGIMNSMLIGGWTSWQLGIIVRDRFAIVVPSRERWRTFLGNGFLIGIGCGLVFGFLGGFSVNSSGELSSRLFFVLRSMALFGVLGGASVSFISMLLALVNVSAIERRTQVGGVFVSLGIGALVSFCLSIFAFITDVFLFGVPSVLVLLAFSSLFLHYGGGAFIQHFCLRLVLAWQGRLPLRLVPFLETMVARGILRRVGGGYLFIHRSLLEYFASLVDGVELGGASGGDAKRQIIGHATSE